jgi:hypothetical protein
VLRRPRIRLKIDLSNQNQAPSRKWFGVFWFKICSFEILPDSFGFHFGRLPVSSLTQKIPGEEK